MLFATNGICYLVFSAWKVKARKILTSSQKKLDLAKLQTLALEGTGLPFTSRVKDKLRAILASHPSGAVPAGAIEAAARYRLLNICCDCYFLVTKGIAIIVHSTFIQMEYLIYNTYILTNSDGAGGKPSKRAIKAELHHNNANVGSISAESWAARVVASRVEECVSSDEEDNYERSVYRGHGSSEGGGVDAALLSSTYLHDYPPFSAQNMATIPEALWPVQLLVVRRRPAPSSVGVHIAAAANSNAPQTTSVPIGVGSAGPSTSSSSSSAAAAAGQSS